MKSHWKKFYPCDCHGEGIMLSVEDFEDGDMNPCIDLAYFRNLPQYCNSTMPLGARIRFALQILIKGEPFTDMVILRQETAKELAKDLLKFANKKIKRAKKSKLYTEPFDLNNLYHIENAL